MLRHLLIAFAFVGALMVPAYADEAANVAIVKDYLAAWNAKDIDKAASYFADDVTYYDASVGTPVEGMADAKAKVVASFINAVPDLKWEMLGDPIAQGDMVAFQWRFSGTNTAAWGDGTEPANKPFMFVGASVFSVKDGKIKTQSDYYDALGFYKQLGWM